MVSPARAQVQSLALASSFEVPGEGWRRVVVEPVGADALLVDLFRVGENPSFQARPAVFRPIENISVPGVGDINARCTG